MRIRHLSALLLLGSPLAAQQPRQLTAADYARAEQFLAAGVNQLLTNADIRPNWLPDNRFWYRSSGAGGTRFVIFDPARGTKADAFEHSRLASALSAATRSTVDAGRLPFQSFDLSRDGRLIELSIGGRRWTCRLDAYTCSAPDTIPAARRAPEHSSVSPDGRTAVFIRNHNLWARDLTTGTERQLTRDGMQDFGYATDNAGWIHSDDPVVTWSPDSRKIATFQHDARGVGDMVLTATNVGLPRVDRWKYPLPGDSVIFRIHRVIIDVPSARLTRLRMPPDPHRSTVSDHVNCDGSMCDLQWFPDGSKIAFISSSRDHKRAWFRVADANSGDVRTVLEETSSTQIGDASLTENLWRVLPATNELIWWSHRDNWLQLYLYDLGTGRLKNKITRDTGNVQEIVRVDERARVIYYVGGARERGRDPYFHHLYRVGFDGSGSTLLTPEDAHHAVSVSPDGRYFVDTYSTPATAPVTVLREVSGRVLSTVERADITRLLATGWRPPVRFSVKARDGRTDIYGLMYLPTRLDSARKYPIVNHIYPGPQSGSVGPRSFAAARADRQALAELGFIVVSIDGMGTPGRSKSFMDAYYGRMGDNTLADQVSGMRELARRYPFIGIDRVGIWGHSGGGFAAAAAMFRHADFFDVGVAQSGNHDQRSYEDDWGERYQGLLVRQGATDNYAAEANQTHAANLKGKLLLVHGGMDDNVPPVNTMLVVDALIAANRDFDLLILPNARHGYGATNNYVVRRRWDYFVRHLLGAEPPREFRIGGRQ